MFASRICCSINLVPIQCKSLAKLSTFKEHMNTLYRRFLCEHFFYCQIQMSHAGLGDNGPAVHLLAGGSNKACFCPNTTKKETMILAVTR